MALAVTLYLLLSGLFLYAGLVLSGKKHRSPMVLILATGTGLIAWAVWNRPHLVTMIYPGADAIVFSNLFPLAAVIAAPTAVRLGKTKAQRVRTAILMTVLLFAAFSGTARMFGEPAESGRTEYFPDGTCRQTNVDTCSAAAAVTLLKQHGLDATESEMVNLALTKAGRGTHPLGLYRALKIKTKETNETLRVKYRAIDSSALLNLGKPAIVNVGLLHSPRTPLETDLKEKYQWEPGVVHSVVVLGSDSKDVHVADPDFGIEKWSDEGFRALYQGTAIWIE